MIITYTKEQLKIEVQENQIPVLVMEDPGIFSGFVGSFFLQSEGEDGNIVLSDGNKELALSKSSMIVSDYFSLDLNGRKIQARLFSQLKEAAADTGIGKEDFTSLGIDLLEKIISASRFDHITYDLNLEWNDIFKLFGVRIEEDYTSLSEKILSLLRVCAQLLDLKLLAFVNLKSYLSENEVLEVYRMAGYLKLNLLMIESTERTKLPGEKIYIIDRDKCLIIK